MAKLCNLLRENECLNSTTPLPDIQENCRFAREPKAVNAIKIIACAILFLFSFGGNALVIAVICRTRKLRTYFNLIILNMAISDLLMALFGIPRRINNVIHLKGEWLVNGILGLVTCKFLPFTEFTSLAVSLLTLQLIAVQRFLSVVFASKKIKLINSRKRFAISICSIWLLGSVHSSWLFYKYKIYHQGDKQYCISYWGPLFNHMKTRRIEIPIVLVVLTLFPFLFITTLYSVVIIFLRQQRARFHLASVAFQRKAKKYRRVTFALVTVVFVFFVSWIPLNVYLFLSVYVWEYELPCHARQIVFSATLLTYVSASTNPLIYFIYLGDFRRALKRFSCWIQFERVFMSLKNRRRFMGTAEIMLTIEPVPPKAVVLLNMRPLEV